MTLSWMQGGVKKGRRKKAAGSRASAVAPADHVRARCAINIAVEDGPHIELLESLKMRIATVRTLRADRATPLLGHDRCTGGEFNFEIIARIRAMDDRAHREPPE
jgi:hypothetical protein